MSSKIKNIANSYKNPLPVEEDWFKDRISKCITCPLNTKNGAELKSWIDKGVEKVFVNEEYGQCTLCGCPTDRKASQKPESCPDNPSKWGALVTESSKGVQSITDMFTVECNSGVNSISTKGGTFVVDALDVEKDLFLSFNVKTKFKGKALQFIPGCASCTTGVIDRKDELYTLKVKIDKEEKGYHSVAFSVTFDREGIVGRASIISLQFKVNFNKI